jgi:hypothetical protein
LGDRAEYSLKKADVLNELNNSDEETLYLTGGEPTLHPNFNEILNKGLSLFSNVIFFTNGKGLSSVDTYLLSDNRLTIVLSFHTETQFKKGLVAVRNIIKKPICFFILTTERVKLINCLIKYSELINSIYLLYPNSLGFQKHNYEFTEWLKLISISNEILFPIRSWVYFEPSFIVSNLYGSIAQNCYPQSDTFINYDNRKYFCCLAAQSKTTKYTNKQIGCPALIKRFGSDPRLNNLPKGIFLICPLFTYPLQHYKNVFIKST